MIFREIFFSIQKNVRWIINVEKNHSNGSRLDRLIDIYFFDERKLHRCHETNSLNFWSFIGRKVNILSINNYPSSINTFYIY